MAGTAPIAPPRPMLGERLGHQFGGQTGSVLGSVLDTSWDPCLDNLYTGFWRRFGSFFGSPTCGRQELKTNEFKGVWGVPAHNRRLFWDPGFRFYERVIDDALGLFRDPFWLQIGSQFWGQSGVRSGAALMHCEMAGRAVSAKTAQTVI